MEMDTILFREFESLHWPKVKQKFILEYFRWNSLNRM
jgi:hypothetical protein